MLVYAYSLVARFLGLLFIGTFIDYCLDGLVVSGIQVCFVGV